MELLREERKKGNPFEIIPKGRDKIAAEGYKFLSWWVRKNRDELNQRFQDMFLDMILYGSHVPKVSWDMGAQIKEEMSKGRVLGHFC